MRTGILAGFWTRNIAVYDCGTDRTCFGFVQAAFCLVIRKQVAPEVAKWLRLALALAFTRRCCRKPTGVWDGIVVFEIVGEAGILTRMRAVLRVFGARDGGLKCLFNVAIIFLEFTRASGMDVSPIHAYEHRRALLLALVRTSSRLALCVISVTGGRNREPNLVAVGVANVAVGLRTPQCARVHIQTEETHRVRLHGG